MATQIGLYNRALDLIGDERLASLSQARVSRHALDDAYSIVLTECLEDAIWTFALRTASAASTSLPSPDHGFDYAFTVPSDKVRTYLLFKDAESLTPLTDVVELNGKYLSKVTPLYVRYTSNDASYGGLLSAWPWAYERYVSAALASKVCYQLTRSQERCDKVDEHMAATLLMARASDAQTNQPGVLPYNILVRREFNRGAENMEPWPFPVQPVTAGDEQR